MNIYDEDGIKVEAVELVDGVSTNGRLYEVIFADGRKELFDFHFGNKNGTDLNGLTNEVLVTILHHRLIILNTEQQCSENDEIIQHLARVEFLLRKRRFNKISEQAQKDRVFYFT